MRRLTLLLIIIVSLLQLSVQIGNFYNNNHRSFAAPNVIINEVELNPSGTDTGQEKAELYNPSESPVDIGGWTLSSTSGANSAVVTISEGLVIPPKGYVLIDRTMQWLDNEGEVIVLHDDTETIVDHFSYFSDIDNNDNTWQRLPDGGNKWIFSMSSLGSANIGKADQAEMPLPQPSSSPKLPPSTSTVLSTGNSNNSDSYKADTWANGTLANQRELKIVFIDVGQGDSILIIMPSNDTVLIDGGDRQSSDEVLSILNELAISEIDALVATHPHADHIGGLIDVIKNAYVRQVIDSGQVHTTQTFEDLLDAIYAAQIPLMSVRAGDSIDIDPHVKLDVLNPPDSLPVGTNNEDVFNDNSVVIKLTYGEFTALFTGDMENDNEERLLATSAKVLDADVLKAGHHGSRTSSGDEFLNAVSPEAVVISVGSNNTYGHPHQEALDRIATAGVERILRTDINGTIILTATEDGNYGIESKESNTVVMVIPEFDDIAILIAGTAIMASTVALFDWRKRMHGKSKGRGN